MIKILTNDCIIENTIIILFYKKQKKYTVISIVHNILHRTYYYILKIYNVSSIYKKNFVPHNIHLLIEK